MKAFQEHTSISKHAIPAPFALSKNTSSGLFSKSSPATLLSFSIGLKSTSFGTDAVEKVPPSLDVEKTDAGSDI